MANIRIISSTYNSITADIENLSNPQNTYASFRVRINGGSWQTISVQSGYTLYDTGNYTFSGLSGNTYYTIEGQAQVGSTWYTVTSASMTTPSPPRVFSYFTMSPSTDVTYNVGNTINCTTRAYYNDGYNEDVTNSTSWTTGNPSVASITSGGKVTCLAGGTTRISATYNGGTLFFWLTVNVPTPTLSTPTLTARQDLTVSEVIWFSIGSVANAQTYEVVDDVNGLTYTFYSSGLHSITTTMPWIHNIKVRACAPGYNSSAYSATVALKALFRTPSLTSISATKDTVGFTIEHVQSANYRVELRNASNTIISTYDFINGYQTITGLTANTSYNLVVYAYNPSFVNSAPSSPYPFKTQDLPTINPPTLTLTKYATYVNYQVTQPSNAVSYYISIYANDGVAEERKLLVTSSGGYTTTGTFNSLTPGNTYTIIVSSNPATGYKGNSTSQTITLPINAIVAISGITSTTASVTVNSLEYFENAYASIKGMIETVDGGTYFSTGTSVNLMASPAQSRSNTNTVQFTGLPAGRTFQAVVNLTTYERRYDTNGNRLADVQVSYKIYSSSFKTGNRPTNFTGFDSFYSGMPLTISGSTVYVMPATTWNSFCSKINEFRNYKGLASSSFTTVSRDTSFTATIFNEAVIALSLNNFNTFFNGYTAPGLALAGQEIGANLLKNMASCINSIT